MGSLTKTTTKSFSWSVLPMIIGLSLIFIFRWQINLLTLDEEEAKSLGINVRKYRLIFIVASTLLSAAAVCLGGLIPFPFVHGTSTWRCHKYHGRPLLYLSYHQTKGARVIICFWKLKMFLAVTAMVIF